MTRTMATGRRHFNDRLQLGGIVVNRYRGDRRDRVEWAGQLRADCAGHLIELFVPEREVIASAASAAVPFPAHGARARDVTEALAAIATRPFPT